MMARGSLLRKYAIYFVTLVSIALAASGGIGVYFTYQESKSALLDLQREKAAAAASRIEAYVQEIEHQIGWMRLPQAGAASPEQRRFDYLKLLRQVPAITDVVQLDRSGAERLRVSRLGMDVVGGNEDLANDPKFTVARSGKTYFSPVYFRKETEPYMTIAMSGVSEEAGITVAEVNLKFIWDVISRIKIGDRGIAYAIDGNGRLIAHPDISQVLQKTDLSKLPQVQAAVAALAAPGGDVKQVSIARNLQGHEVLSAYASIQPLGWHVFVEQPIEEAFAPLYASLKRTGLLLLAGLVLSVLASLFVARRMVSPIRAVQEGAARIGTGNLDQRIDVRTGDELQALADQFNVMAERLKDSYGSLERKVVERTAALTESLDQQTAITAILRVISQSPTDVTPVLETVARNAAELCDSRDARILMVDGDVLHYVAGFGDVIFDTSNPIRPLNRGLVMGRAVIDRTVVHVEDIATPAAMVEYPISQAYQRAHGFHTTLGVPLLKDNVALGVILLRRNEVRPFSDKQIELVRTFADQAVIAIDNVRLFNETKESLEQQTVTADILKVISSSPTDTQPVFDAIVKSGVRLFGGLEMSLRLVKGDHTELMATTETGIDGRNFSTPLDDDRRASTRAILRREVVQISDILAEQWIPEVTKERARRRGHRAVLHVPMLRENTAIGAISVYRGTPAPFSDKEVALLQVFADQAVIAIENVRLFHEIQEKSLQLEIANKHKSEFLANMSHELRTPLNAVIGFSEVLLASMFGPMNEKQMEYVNDIHESGRHLLSLINDILDLSKVEAGRMELEAAPYNLVEAIGNALTLVRERAARHNIDLQSALDENIGAIKGDERKFKQIMLNLLSNAVKFTPEGGRITVAAHSREGGVEISVSDTGIGIASEDQEAVFEEFRQVGKDYTKKAEGTGLGLALTRKFVELHGGRIWCNSEPGKGSTFTFTLPLEPAAAAPAAATH